MTTKAKNTQKYKKGDLVDTSFGRLIVDKWKWNGFTWMYTFSNRENLVLGEEYLRKVPMKTVQADIYFDVRYSHLVEVTVPVDTPDKTVTDLALAACEEEMAPYLESAFEGSSGCYVHDSYTPKSVDVQDEEILK